jgi:hypothetical protein
VSIPLAELREVALENLYKQFSFSISLSHSLSLYIYLYVNALLMRVIKLCSQSELSRENLVELSF